MAGSLTAREKKELARLARRLREEFGATDVRIFGSAARGEMDAESDIDLLVVLPDASLDTKLRVSERCFKSSLAIDRLVSPLVMSVERAQDPILAASAFMRAIGMEALPV